MMKRFKVAFILVLFAFGVSFRCIGVWIYNLIVAAVTLGVHIGPLMSQSWSDLYFFPVRLILAILILFGLGKNWIEKVFPESINFKTIYNYVYSG